MIWKLDSDRPIYTQLLEQLQKYIVSGKYGPGSKLPSVRELAADAGVNPNTMQRAFTELERDGLIITQRTTGRFVTEDTDRIAAIRSNLAQNLLADFFAGMEELGYSSPEISNFLKNEQHKWEN